jgi:hypothetical protein
MHAKLGCLAALAAYAMASDVADLKKDTFDAFIKDNAIVLAECTFSRRPSSVPR